ncbi:MAG TPA: DUF433 domain-containing protein [Longimicrobium sp.]|nr:DUF433 domain-containing protein [Longimicrobium sp.]
MIEMERRMSGPGLSPREAAFVTGLSEKTINQAIDRAEVEPLPARRADDRERMLPFRELVYLRLRGQVGRLLSPEGKRKLREQLGQAGIPEHPALVTIGALSVHIAPDVNTLRERIAEMERLWSFIAVDPNIRAGEPVIRGTRIPVHVLSDLAAQGAPLEELLEDYPALTRESLEAALAWARIYPRRGRPPRAGWKNGVVIRRGS